MQEGTRRIVFVDLEAAGGEISRPIIQVAAVAVGNDLREVEAFEAKLKCEPPRGTHPNTAAACRQLMEFIAKDEDPFKPVPRDAVCGMSFRPGYATVRGTLFGQQVDAQFDGHNTCEQKRWDRLDSLLNIGR